MVRYDNLTTAVAKVLKGRRRVETDRFVALRSHYLFDSEFTRRGVRAPREGWRGGRGRPVSPPPSGPGPRVAVAGAQRADRCGCIRDLERTIRGRAETVGRYCGGECSAARAAREAFDAREQATPRVDCKALATVRQNRYSVPVALVGRKLRRRSARGRSRSPTSPRGREPRAAAGPLRRLGTARSLSRAARRASPVRSRSSLALRQERERGRWP